jgi:hypothetical protein
VLALLVPRLVPPDESPAGPRPSRSLDLAGLLAAACSVLLIVLPLVLGREAGWPGARRSGHSHWDQGDRRARGGGGRINSGIMEAMCVMM